MAKPLPLPLQKIPTGQIRWIVDRFHVSTSALTIARDIRRRANRTTWTPQDTRAAIRYALRCHAQNRGLYAYVMGGR